MKKSIIGSIILIMVLVYRNDGFARDPYNGNGIPGHINNKEVLLITVSGEAPRNDSGYLHEESDKGESTDDAPSGPAVKGNNDEIDGGTVAQKESSTAVKEQSELHERLKERPATENDRNEKTHSPEWKGREYIGLFAGYGGHIPVADYDGRFKPSHLFSCALGIYAINLRGISPELHFRYTEMNGVHSAAMYGSSMKLTQFFPGLVYRHHFTLPRNILTLYGRVWDGFCRIEYRSANPYFIFMEERIVEYVNILGLSAGCCYDLFHGVLIGADLSYSVVFTAGKPLQSAAVTLNAGYRIL